MTKQVKSSTLVARKAVGNNPNPSARVTSYRCDETGSTVITNIVREPKSPFNGQKLTRLNPTLEMVIEGADFDKMVHVGTCTGPKCGVDLFTARDELKETAGLELCCPMCAAPFTMPNAVAPVAAPVPPAATTASPDDDDEDPGFDGDVILLDETETDEGDDENADGVTVDEDGYYVNADGDYCDADGNLVDDPIMADTNGEGDDEEEDAAVNTKQTKGQRAPQEAASLDQAVALLANGYVMLAVEENPSNLENFREVAEALDALDTNGETAMLTHETADAALAAAVAAGPEADVNAIMDKIGEPAEKDLAATFAAVLPLIEKKVGEPTLAMWQKLVAAFTPAPETAAAPEQPAAEAPAAETPPAPEKNEGEPAQAGTVGLPPTAAEVVPPQNPKGPEPEAPAAPVAAEAPKPGSTISVDVSAQIDFDPRLITVAPVQPGHFAVFATVDGAIHPLGMIDAASAIESNRHMFTGEPKIALIARAFTVACEAGDPADLGFKPITANIELDEIVAGQVTAKVEAATVEISSQSATAVESFTQCLQIATAGMNKGLFPNVLVDRLGTELRRRQIANPTGLAQKIVASVADDYMDAVLERAKNYAGQTVAERNAAAKVIAEAAGTEIDETGEESPRFSTAALPSPATPEQSNVVKFEEPAPRPRSLFGDVGFGGFGTGR